MKKENLYKNTQSNSYEVVFRVKKQVDKIKDVFTKRELFLADYTATQKSVIDYLKFISYIDQLRKNSAFIEASNNIS
jgi:hypothetical protein